MKRLFGILTRPADTCGGRLSFGDAPRTRSVKRARAPSMATGRATIR